FVLGTWLALQDVVRMVRGAWIVASAAAYVLSGFALRRAAAGQMLAIALRTQAAALLVVAVPVALSGAAVVLVWLGMAIGFGVVGARLNLVISRVASAATWMAAIAYLILAVQSAEIPPDAEEISFTVRGTAVPLYVLLGWITATAGLAVAWLLTTRAYAPVSDTHDVLSTEEGPAVAAEPVAEPGWSLAAPAEEFARSGRFLAAVAGTVWLAASFHGLPPAAATLAFVGWAWLLVAI